MSESTAPTHVIRFGTYEADLRAGELRKNGQKIKIQEQPFHVLAMLLEHPGEIVTREELQKALWSTDTFVDFEHGLNKTINKIREALGDDADNPRFVETLARRGYRFIAPVAGPDGVRLDAIEKGTRRVPLDTRWVALVGAVLFAVGVFTYWLTRRPPTPTEPKQRRLTFNPSENAVNGGTISPDGKYLAYSDQMGMHLKLIETGETRSIPEPEGPPVNRALWWPSGWFPDGTKFIATGTEPDGGLGTWVISILGGPPRKLRDDVDGWSVSPDGTLMAAGVGVALLRFHEIWLMGVQGEESRRLVSSAEGDEFFWATWSPDGGRISYWRLHHAPDKVECSIETRDLKGGQPTIVLSDPRLCAGHHPRWSPDGRIIYELAEPGPNQNDSNLWEIRVDTRTGAPTGKPRRITNWVGVSPRILSLTADGKRLGFLKESIQSDVYVGQLESNGRRLEDPRRLTLDERNDFPSVWMPDSKAVLFQSDRQGTMDIFRQAIGQESAEPVVTGPDYKWMTVVSPDGSWILYISQSTPLTLPQPAGFFSPAPNVPIRIMRVPTSGGPPQVVTEGRGVSGLACARSPATVCVFSESTPDRKQLIFSALDPLQGRGRELTRINLKQPVVSYDWALSPDGSYLALTQCDDREGRIQIIPVAGGKVREVVVGGWARLYRISWSADGKGMFVGILEAPHATLLYVDLEGRAHVLWEQKLPGWWNTWGVPSPDGRYLALMGSTRERNIWILENF